MVDLKTFDLHLLVALDALITERSVSGAAQRIGIGQPAMSHALRRLRDDPLLVRAGSTMQPTARALELAAPVGRVLDDVRRTVLADQVFRPARLAMHCRDAIGLAASEPPIEANGFDVAMVWHRRTDADPAQRRFRDRVRHAAADG
jgi:DNA-binding transcriptional LysR family regulator